MPSIAERLSGRRDVSSLPTLAPSSSGSRLSTPPTSGGSSETPSTGGPTDLWQLKRRLQRRLVTELLPRQDHSGGNHMRQRLETLFGELLDEEAVLLTRTDRARLFEAISADILAFGPIEPLLHDDTVTEIMVNGPFQVYVERNGLIEETDIVFEDDDHVKRIIDRIVSPLGRRCDEASPMVDARLPDGSRVNAIIPPLSVKGPILTIRKFSRVPLTIQDLVGYGALTTQM